MEVRYAEGYEIEDDPEMRGRIVLCIERDYVSDVSVDLYGLLTLRAEIDRFLFTRLADKEKADGDNDGR